MNTKYDDCKSIEDTRNILLQSCESLQAQDSSERDCVVAEVGEKSYAEEEKVSESGSVWEAVTQSGVKFSDITGASLALQAIWEALIIPIKYPLIFKQVKANAWMSVLLYGPPGTGKSMIARATASESSANFYTACCAELTSKWVGGSEKLLKALFSHARENSPSIVFFDEIDSIAGMRDAQKSIADQRLTNQLLLELDTCVYSKGTVSVFVIAATNLPWQIDPAVIRRFPKRIYIALPSSEDRADMFRKAFYGVVHLSEQEMVNVVEKTNGFSGADIKNIVNDISLEPLRALTRARTFLVNTDESNVVTVQAVSDHSIATGRDYLVCDTNFETVVAKFSQEAMIVTPVTLAMVFGCIDTCQTSVDSLTIQKYNDYNSTH